MSLRELAPEYIRAIAPYQIGKPISELARETGIAEADIVKLASNENPLGLSPKAHAAIEQALAELARYPDGNGFDLKARIAQKYNVGLDQIVLGNGSNDILELVSHAFFDHAGFVRLFAIQLCLLSAGGASGRCAPYRGEGS